MASLLRDFSNSVILFKPNNVSINNEIINESVHFKLTDKVHTYVQITILVVAVIIAIA